MTDEEAIKIVRDIEEKIAQYESGEIEDEWDEECRKNWIEKCNS